MFILEWCDLINRDFYFYLDWKQVYNKFKGKLNHLTYFPINLLTVVQQYFISIHSTLYKPNLFMVLLFILLHTLVKVSMLNCLGKFVHFKNYNLR